MFLQPVHFPWLVQGFSFGITHTRRKVLNMISRHPLSRQATRAAGPAFSSGARSRSGASQTFKACVFTIGCALAGVSMFAPGFVQAAEAARGAVSREYAIPAGRLSDALAQFAATAGVPLSFDPQMLADLNSEGLQGRYSVREGFSRLLAGSAYELAELGGGYSLRQAPALPPSLPPSLSKLMSLCNWNR
jgi:iron complex outermembrane receptor protein